MGRIALLQVAQRGSFERGRNLHRIGECTGLCVADPHGEPDAALLATDVDLELLADPNQSDGVPEIARALHPRSAHRDDDVAGLDSRGFGR